MLTWHSSFAALTGYSGSSLAYVLGLDALGLAVRPLYLYGTDYDEQVQAGGMHPRIRALQAQPLRLDAPQVVYAPGDRFSKNSGRYRIGFTMLETDRLPPSWVEQANQMDEVWTPSAWGAEVFRASGVARPIYVVPLGVDAARFQPAPPRTLLRDRTIFLSVFEWGERKAPELLLRAYAAAFGPRDDVLLIVRANNFDGDVDVARQIAALGLPRNGPPIALLLNQHLPAGELGSLYRSADCFVLPSRGEGWGMPILEAMACGLPAIATDWSGQTEFFNAEVGYPLRVRALVPADNTKCVYYHGRRWAEPDLEHLVECMRYVYHQRDEAHAVGQRAAQAARKRWTWSHAAERIIARLRAREQP